MKLKDIIIQRLQHVKSLTKEVSLRQEMRSIPKYELHVHLGGSIRRNTLVELARKNHVDLPAAKKHFLNALTPLEFSSGNETWQLFHQIYMWGWTCIKTCEDLERIVIEFLEDSHEQGVIHTEFTVSGSYLMNAFPFDEWTDAVASGIAAAQRSCSVRAGVILDISRRFGVENAIDTVKKIIKHKPKAICGIGMGGDEVKYPHHLFKDAFSLARENDIKSTVHVAEFTPGETTIGAIDELKPDRLGHALNTAKSEDAYAVLRESGIHVESCPLCNYVAGMGVIDKISEHPIRRYFLDGVPISINTDDPQIFGFDLIDNYICLMKEVDFTFDDFVKINNRAKDYVFCR